MEVNREHSCFRKVFKRVSFLCTFFNLKDSLINKHVKFIAGKKETSPQAAGPTEEGDTLLFCHGEGRVTVLSRFADGETEIQESIEPEATPHSHTYTPTGSQRNPGVKGALCGRFITERKETKPG